MARVEVRLPSLLNAVWDGGQSFSIQADSARAALEAIAEQHPRLAIHFFDESGALRPHVLCFWNGANTRWLDDLNAPARDGDTLQFTQAVSGG